MTLNDIELKNDKYGKIYADGRLTSNRIPAREKSLNNIFNNYCRMRTLEDEQMVVVDSTPVIEEKQEEVIPYDGEKVFARLDEKISVKDMDSTSRFVKERPIVIKKLMSENLFNNSAYAHSRSNVDVVNKTDEKVDSDLSIEDIVRTNADNVSVSIDEEVNSAQTPEKVINEDYQIDVEQLEKDINAYLQTIKFREESKENEEIKVVENESPVVENSDVFVNSKSLDDIMEAIYKIPQNIYLSSETPVKSDEEAVIRDDIYVAPGRDENEYNPVETAVIDVEDTTISKSSQTASIMDAREKLEASMKKLEMARQRAKQGEAEEKTAINLNIETDRKAQEIRDALIKEQDLLAQEINKIDAMAAEYNANADEKFKRAAVERESAECSRRYTRMATAELESIRGMIFDAKSISTDDNVGKVK